MLQSTPNDCDTAHTFPTPLSDFILPRATSFAIIAPNIHIAQAHAQFQVREAENI